MVDSALESLLRRDRVIVVAALATLTVLSWLYILRLAESMHMGGMDMTGWRMVSTGLEMGMVSSLAPWSVWQFALMFLMWAVMMVGMMTPSVAPMVLIYARVGRQAAQQGRALAPTGWFVAGYMLAWVGFALFATAGQWALESAALLTPEMNVGSNTVGGIVLIAAGIYQWTPLKDTCLRQCQAPLAFIQRHGGFRQAPAGSLSLGLRHGLYCIGCCWPLMALLFIGGIMNVLWIAGLAVLILAEKVIPAGRILSRIAGIGLVAMGTQVLVANFP
jgi:predicted metal-binding membrane protein